MRIHVLAIIFRFLKKELVWMAPEITVSHITEKNSEQMSQISFQFTWNAVVRPPFLPTGCCVCN